VLGLGLAVTVSAVRPTVRAVLLEDPFGAGHVPDLADISCRDEFDFTTTETDWVRMCEQFFQDTSARVSSLEPDLVVVRQADFNHRAKVTDNLRVRLVVEGALASAAVKHVPATYLRRGQACAELYPGKNKDTMDDDAKAKVAKAARAEAAAAALSGLFGNRT
jgi:hypothetical protein